MSIGMLGKKIGMTQLFLEQGRFMPVTVIEAGPCVILQIKNKDTDGYDAVQLGFDDRRPVCVNKPDTGRFKKANSNPKKFVKEIRCGLTPDEKAGQDIRVDIFNAGDYVDITGLSKGKGFQGGVKRWGWKGGKASHGSMHHRAPGSIGSNTDPGRVFRGHHMPGRMGNDTCTVGNLKVLKVDKENNLLVIKGSVPGAKNSYLIVRKALKPPKKTVPTAVKPKKDEKPKEKAKEKPKAEEKKDKKK